jgi:hypothetical protein
MFLFAKNMFLFQNVLIFQNIFLFPDFWHGYDKILVKKPTLRRNDQASASYSGQPRIRLPPGLKCLL